MFKKVNYHCLVCKWKQGSRECVECFKNNDFIGVKEHG